MEFYVPMMLSVLGTLVYHIAQKTMPREVSPFFPLAIAFSFAAFICAAILLSTTPAPWPIWRAMLPSSVALAFAVVAIETGYLMAYRVGWQLNRAALFSNVTVAVLLIPLGMILFGEQISLRTIAGSSLCILGLILLVK